MKRILLGNFLYGWSGWTEKFSSLGRRSLFFYWREEMIVKIAKRITGLIENLCFGLIIKPLGNFCKKSYLTKAKQNSPACVKRNRFAVCLLIVLIFGAGSFGCWFDFLESYSVTYDANAPSGKSVSSGSVPVDSYYYVDGQIVTVLGNTNDLVLDGYTFNGWNTASDGSGTSYTAGSTFSMGADDVRLYAMWYNGLGIIWTQTTVLGSANNWYGVAYGNGVFVAVASGSQVAASSSDGVTWTQRTLSGSYYWDSIAYGGGLFVAVATVSTAIASTSPDGITWTSRSLPYSANWTDVTYGGDRFVAVSNGTVSAYSTSGTSWSSGGSLPSSQNWKVCYGNGLFVAYYGSTTSATSSNGVTWTSRTLPLSASSIGYGNGLFVAVVSGSSSYATSTDGINWTSRTLPSSNSWKWGAYGSGIYLLFSTGSNAALISSDGITWTEETLPASGWNYGAYGNGSFVLLKYSSNVGAVSP